MCIIEDTPEKEVNGVVIENTCEGTDLVSRNASFFVCTFAVSGAHALVHEVLSRRVRCEYGSKRRPR
jgi:hypothetical protein